MLYQIFYNQSSFRHVLTDNHLIKPFGVHLARKTARDPAFLYDDERSPNLSNHNTLCEWRVLYYVWKHHKTEWVGFTSWRHEKKGFTPDIDRIDAAWINSALKKQPIMGFANKPPKDLFINNYNNNQKNPLKTQFLQWSNIEKQIGIEINDLREIPMAKYHSAPYWDFVVQTFQRLYGFNLETHLDWEQLGEIVDLHTWCNAFVARWEYFDEYMTLFSPVVLKMLEHFGSHPTDLELAYICERLIILFNYLRYSDNRFYITSATEPGNKAWAKELSTRTRTPGISIVVCSCDNIKFDAFKQNALAVFGKEVQIVRIRDAKSIAEGYNRGISQAHGEIVIFCHDDIVLLTDNLAEIIIEDLEQCDIVGVAGTSRLLEGKWISAGHPFVHGQVAHDNQGDNSKYQLSVYGLGRDNVIVRDIQALDGLFIAVRRRVLDKIHFDQERFDGFHLYDLDFSYSAFLNDFQLIIDHRIHILHNSPGKFDAIWQQYYHRFNQKFAHSLSRPERNMLCIIKGMGFNTLKLLSNEMKAQANGCRVFISRQKNIHGQLQQINTYDDGRNLSHILGESRLIPFKNDHVSYIKITHIEVDGLELSEFFRVCKHGAIIEFWFDPVTTKCNAGSEMARHDMGGIFSRCPEVLRFSDGHVSYGAMIRQAVLDVDTESRCIYFQVAKHHEILPQNC